MPKSYRINILDEELLLEILNSNCSCFQSRCTYKGNTINVFITINTKHSENIDSFKPIRIIYHNRYYAYNKIPRNKFRRELYINDNEILLSRIIDRSIRSKLPYTKYNIEINLIPINCTNTTELETSCIISVSALLKILFKDSFSTVIPIKSQIERSKILFTLSSGGINTIEMNGMSKIEDIVDTIKTYTSRVNAEYKEIENALSSIEQSYIDKNLILYNNHSQNTDIEKYAEFISDVRFSCKNSSEAYNALKAKVLKDICKDNSIDEHFLSLHVSNICARSVVSMINNTNQRIDGRKPEDIRSLSIELHSYKNIDVALTITRGNTRVFAALIIGDTMDRIFEDDNLYFDNKYTRDVFVHYNFLPFTVNEYSKSSYVKRREIGHGYIIENSIKETIMNNSIKNNSIRIVCDVLSSDGSTSMASVMSSSIACNILGISSNNLIGITYGGIYDKNGDIKILSDISGIEDEVGLFDFKVVLGNNHCITYIQFDSKDISISPNIVEDILRKSVDQSNEYINVCKKYSSNKIKSKKILSSYCIHINEYKKHQFSFKNILSNIEKENNIKIDMKIKNIIKLYGYTSNIKKAIESINGLIYKLDMTK